MLRTLAPLGIGALLVSAPAFAQSCPQLVELTISAKAGNSNPAPTTVDPSLQLAPQADRPFVAFGGKHYFAATSGARGRELYRTDGTTAGTELVFDVNPGAASAFPRELVVWNGKLYFVADSAASGAELWVTDGVTTQMVVDLNPNGSGRVQGLAVLNAGLVFVGQDGASGQAVWFTDGTAAGTSQVVPPSALEPLDGTGPSADATTRLHADPTGSFAFFLGRDSFGGVDLFRTDGTLPGTFAVGSAATWSASAPEAYDYDGFAHLGTRTLFTARTAAQGEELWISDGTLAGTQLVADLQAGAFDALVDLNTAAEWNGALYFEATSAATGAELWKTDGTAAGTQLAADVLAGPQGSAPHAMTVWNGALYFVAGAPDLGVGRELWRLDGGGGLALVADLWPGSGSAFGLEEAPLVATPGGLVFAAADPVEGEELWRHDGGSTTRIAATYVSAGDGHPKHLTPLAGGQLLFQATSAQAGSELWGFDGVGAVLVRDFTPEDTATWNTPQIVPDRLGNALFVQLRDQFGGEHLVRWSPAFGAQQIDAFENHNGTALDKQGLLHMQGGGGKLIVQAYDGFTEAPFWMADADSFAPYPVPDGVTELPVFGYPMARLDELLLFMGFTDAFGYEPWVTDGTAAGTVMLGDFAPGSANALWTSAVRLGDHLYFGINSTGFNRPLMRTDGTPAGTTLVKDIVLGSTGGVQSELARLGDLVVFQGSDGLAGDELWVSDGTAAGTVMLKDINPGAVDSSPKDFVAFDGRLYFSARTESRGRELWVTDGTPAGTTMVADIMPGAGHSNPVSMTAAATGLYFAADAPNIGIELWRTDGTAAGTQLVTDLVPGPVGSFPVQMVPASNGVAFIGGNGAASEVHLTDGTAAGTVPLCPGSGLHSLQQLRLVGGHLAFLAREGSSGPNLYVISDFGANAQDLGLASGDLTLHATAPVLGGNMKARLDGGAPGVPKLLVLAAPAEANALFVEPGSASWLSPTSFQLVGQTIGTSLDTNLPVPNLPALTGLHVNLQAWQLGPFGLPARTSNGFALRLGS